jgi:iron complex outermembrane recepter protein
VNSDYDFNITGATTGFVGASYHYQGSKVTDFIGGSPPGYQRPVLPSYQTVDLRTGVDRGGWEVELYVKNVGDSRGINYLTSIMLDGISPPFSAPVIQPRTYGLSIRDKF